MWLQISCFFVLVWFGFALLPLFLWDSAPVLQNRSFYPAPKFYDSASCLYTPSPSTLSSECQTRVQRPRPRRKYTWASNAKETKMRLDSIWRQTLSFEMEDPHKNRKNEREERRNLRCFQEPIPKRQAILLPHRQSSLQTTPRAQCLSSGGMNVLVWWLYKTVPGLQR